MASTSSVHVSGYTSLYRGRGKRRELVDVMEHKASRAKPVLLVDDKPVSIRQPVLRIKVNGGKKPTLVMDDVEVKVKNVSKGGVPHNKKGENGGVPHNKFETLASDSESDYEPRCVIVKGNKVKGAWNKPVMKSVSFEEAPQERKVEDLRVPQRVVVKCGVAKGAWKKSLKEAATTKHGSTDAWVSKSVKGYDEVLNDAKTKLEEELALLRSETSKVKNVTKKIVKEKVFGKTQFEKLQEQRERLKEAEERGDWGDIAVEEKELERMEAEEDMEMEEVFANMTKVWLKTGVEFDENGPY